MYVILIHSSPFSLAKRAVGRKSRESDSLVYYANEKGTKFWTEILFPSLPLYSLFSGTLFFLFLLLLLFFTWNSLLLLSLFRTFLLSRLCSSLSQTRVEMQAGSVRVACDLWRSRSFANVPGSLSREFERDDEEEGAGGEKLTGGRNRPVFESHATRCVHRFITSRFRRSPAQPVLFNTLVFSFSLSLSSPYMRISDCESLAPSPCQRPYVASAKRRNETYETAVSVAKTGKRRFFAA